jgi:hypothetical protein
MLMHHDESITVIASTRSRQEEGRGLQVVVV